MRLFDEVTYICMKGLLFILFLGVLFGEYSFHVWLSVVYVLNNDHAIFAC
jgi:hypothetical protein